MKFNSLQEILDHFNITETDQELIKKHLKKLRKNIHPDKTLGDFKSEEDKKLFNEIQQALEFFKNPTTSLQISKENSVLIKVVKNLSDQKKQEQINQTTSQAKSQLASYLNSSINSYHSQTKTPKITGVIITAAITALWVFPNIAKDHPLLKVLYQFNLVFLLMWIIALVILGILWLKIKSAENIDAQLKQGYKTETVQNHMFILFSKWFQYDHKNYDYVENHTRMLIFSVDDLVLFLMNRYDLLKEMISRENLVDDYYMIKTISEWEKSKKFSSGKKTLFKKYSLLNLIPKPGDIDIESANIIGNIIIQRLLYNKAIEKSSSRGLSDIYNYKIS